MQEPLEWEDGGVLVGPDSVRNVESAWKVTLPEVFVQCVLQHNAGRPAKDTFDIDGEPRVLHRLLSFDEAGSFYVLESYEGIRDRLVDWVFPIAYDPAGNFICLDYRANADCPSIVFWDHEIAYEDPKGALAFVAATFTDLLGMLYAYDFGATSYFDSNE